MTIGYLGVQWSIIIRYTMVWIQTFSPVKVSKLKYSIDASCTRELTDSILFLLIHYIIQNWALQLVIATWHM